MLHLKACIKSAINENNLVEHILVFDGKNEKNIFIQDSFSSFNNLFFYETDNHGGISETSNYGSQKALGDYLLFLDQDDYLEDSWFDFIIQNLDSDTDFAYSDTRTCDENGQIIEHLTYHKPVYSPVRLLGNMYACHFMLVKKSIFEAIGGFRSKFDGSQDHDLVLRLMDLNCKFQHLPKPLYVWRQSKKSTALDPTAKPYAAIAGVKAVESFLTQRKIPAKVSNIDGAPGYYSISFNRRLDPISIIIPTAFTRGIINKEPLIRNLMISIKNQIYASDEILLVVDSNFNEAEFLQIFQDLNLRVGLKFIKDPQPFNFSKRINIGALEAANENLLFLNDDVVFSKNNCIDQLFGYLEHFSHLGVVGELLFDSDGLITHGGHIYAHGGPHHAYVNSADLMAHFGDNLIDREVSGVTGAVMATKRSLWAAVGGFSVKFPNNFNDVDFCLKIRQIGKDILLVNSAPGFHDESSTREPTVKSWEVKLLKRRWAHELEQDSYTRSKLALANFHNLS